MRIRLRLLCFALIAFIGLGLGAAPIGAESDPRHDGARRTAADGGGGGGRHHHRDDDDDECEKDEDEDEDEGRDEDDDASIRLERLGPAARGAPKIRYVPGELLVRFRAGTSDAEMEASATRAGGGLADRIPELGFHVIAVPPTRIQQALTSLRSEASVEAVERDVFLEGLDTVPNDVLWSTQWGSRVVGTPRAWDATKGAPTVLIAVLDTGIDPPHPDLAGAMVPGRDFVNDDADSSDDQGHGTAVAGVIAARTNNREGQSGVCWVCSLISVKVLDQNRAGKTSTIATGIVWAADHGARVLNMSFGGPGTTSALGAAVRYASAKGAVLVAAAGNSGSDTLFYPAAYSEVIGVAATTEEDARYGWSNYGDWVQVAAPGCNTAPRLGGGYVDFCGTSAAAPIVTGIAGLAISLNPTISKSAVEQAIARSATPLPSVARFGRVNAPAVMSAVSLTGSLPPLEPPPPPPSPPVAAPPPPPPAPPPVSPVAAPPPPTVAAPVNVQRPRLRGRARVGRLLRVLPGAWSPAPTRFVYRWRRCARTGARCRAIVAARKQTYRLRRRDRGHRLRAVVVAMNAGGATTAASGASSVVRVVRVRR